MVLTSVVLMQFSQYSSLESIEHCFVITQRLALIVWAFSWQWTNTDTDDDERDTDDDNDDDQYNDDDNQYDDEDENDDDDQYDDAWLAVYDGWQQSSVEKIKRLWPLSAYNKYKYHASAKNTMQV